MGWEMFFGAVVALTASAGLLWGVWATSLDVSTKYFLTNIFLVILIWLYIIFKVEGRITKLEKRK